MSLNNEQPNRTELRAARYSIIESFTITNLHGYRTISLSSKYAATISIAQNGAGKTTLLNALDAFLRGQFVRLKNIQFTDIRCKIRGVEDEFVINFRDIQELAAHPIESEIFKFAKRYELEPDRVFGFLAGEYTSIRNDYSLLSEEPVFEAASRSLGYNYTKATAYLDQLHSEIYSRNPTLSYIQNKLAVALKGIDILYLPTYRRIEVPIISSSDDARLGRRKRPKIKIPYDMYSGDIEFGLSDISARLARLNNEVVSQSNSGYRKISGDIINELLDDSFASRSEKDLDVPSSEDLKLLFARLREGSRIAPFPDVSVPNLEKVLLNPAMGDNKNRFLFYFLGKLNSVMQATKNIEGQVEDFIENCNRYLRQYSFDVGKPVTELDGRLDSKELRLKKSDMSVYAVSLPTERIIPLDFLSSGEKQMISLFAKLYLYPNRKIVLIDEPELSLSLDWQRLILPDVINAPACDQLIAITHSPFVFDNALEPFARSISIDVDLTRLPSVDGVQGLLEL